MRVILTDGINVTGSSGETVEAASAVAGGFNPIIIVLIGLVIFIIFLLVFLSMKSKGGSSKNVKRNKKVAPKTVSQQEKAKIRQQERELKKKNREAAENAARRKATGEPVELREIKLEDEEVRAQKERERLAEQEQERLQRKKEQQEFELTQNYDVDEEYEDNKVDDSGDGFGIFDDTEIADAVVDSEDSQQETLSDSQQGFVLDPVEEDQLNQQMGSLDIGDDVLELELEGPSVQEELPDNEMLGFDDSEQPEDELLEEDATNSFGDLDLEEEEPLLDLEEEEPLLDLTEEETLEEDFTESLEESTGTEDWGLENDIDTPVDEKPIEESEVVNPEELNIYVVTGKVSEAFDLPEELKHLIHSAHYTLLGATMYRVNGARVSQLDSLAVNDAVEVLCPVILSDSKEYYAEGSVLNFAGNTPADVTLIRGQNNVSGLNISFRVPVEMTDIDGVTVALGFDTKDFTNNRIGLYCDVCIVNR